jgi:predicted component of type VI protein secretion system
MSNYLLTRAILVAAMSACFAASGCTADIHDNVVHIDATLDVTTDADVNHLHPGDAIALTITASGLDADGNFEIYFDDTNSDALVVTAALQVEVTIPADADLGKHDIICRRHKKDGTPTDLEFNLSITIE